MQTRVEAAARFEQVEEVAYKLRFELGADQPTFKIRAEIALVMRHERGPLLIDFEGDSIAAVTVDGTALTNYSYDIALGRLILPREALKRGAHTIVVEALASTATMAWA